MLGQEICAEIQKEIAIIKAAYETFTHLKDCNKSCLAVKDFVLVKTFLNFSSRVRSLSSIPSLQQSELPRSTLYTLKRVSEKGGQQ